MSISKFIKKPIQIEAIQFTREPDCLKALSDFLGVTIKISCERRLNGKLELEIPTLEDGHDGRAKHVASENDWIIKGIHGEFYPCKPDIFNETYEEVK